MAINPKLEFYRFKLNPKGQDDFKSFRDFAVEELGARKGSSETQLFEKFLSHLLSSLNEKYAKDNRLKKEITLIKKSSANKHLNLRPSFMATHNIIHGVINGGPYGRDGILAETNDKENSSILGRDKSVLSFFYFLLYIPTDHNEGCFIIHSNSSDQSVTQLFRNFISNVFRGDSFYKAQCEPFCPKSFQDEFKKGATLQSMTFTRSFVESIPNTHGLSHLLDHYEIKIEAIPKNKNILMSKAVDVRNFFVKKIFGNASNPKLLSDFDKTKVDAKNTVTNTSKVFQWNNIDNDFIPVIYLKGRIEEVNEDGTPDFDALHKLCMSYFKDEVLPEIRPDLDVTKAS